MSRPGWAQNLADHTGSCVFNLSLSRSMVAMLEHIRDNATVARAERPLPKTSHFITGNAALTRRGLIERIPREAVDGEYKNVQWFETVLTPAGHAVCDLLVMAGLIAKPRIRATA